MSVTQTLKKENVIMWELAAVPDTEQLLSTEPTQVIVGPKIPEILGLVPEECYWHVKIQWRYLGP